MMDKRGHIQAEAEVEEEAWDEQMLLKLQRQQKLQ